MDFYVFNMNLWYLCFSLFEQIACCPHDPNIPLIIRPIGVGEAAAKPAT